MADPCPPSIAVIESECLGEVKQSLESLLSRSDSASGEEEGEEAEAPTLAVPCSVQGKTRVTSRKGRKISVNEAVKVATSFERLYAVPAYGQGVRVSEGSGGSLVSPRVDIQARLALVGRLGELSRASLPPHNQISLLSVEPLSWLCSYNYSSKASRISVPE